MQGVTERVSVEAWEGVGALQARTSPRPYACTSILILLLLTAWPALAQREAALQTVRPTMRAQAQRADTALTLRTRAVPRGRLDVTSGLLRAAYRLETRAYAGSPEHAARAYLQETAPTYGLTRPADDLRLEGVRRTARSSHVTFQQTLRGVPVYGRRVRVNLDAQGRPTLVLNGYAPHLEERATAFDPQPSLSVEEARARAREAFTTDARTGTPELVVYPAAAPRLAWRLHAWTPGTPADWEILLDAHTGEILLLEDRMLYDRFAPGNGEAGKRGNGVQEDDAADEREGRSDDGGAIDLASASPRSTTHDPRSTDTALPLPLSPSPRRSVSQTDGAGLIFDPDPLTTAGAVYGEPGFVDDGDTDTPALNAQRVAVTLPGISQGDDGLYRLDGPYVRIIGGDAGAGFLSYTVPAESAPDAFAYTRSDDRFEAVMAYYHVDLSQRYVQTLDVGYPIQEAPLRVHPQAYTDDVSYYTASKNVIGFGVGGVDDAEDADVLWHEYGHALLEDSAPGLSVTDEGRALHEGWSDYWAASRSRHQIETGTVPERDWRRLFQWDGNNPNISPPWYGRTLDATGRYPETTRCDDANDELRDGCDWYTDGIFWATAMMDVYTALGRTVTDRLHVAALGYLVAPVTFRDAAEAVVQADLDLYGGAHVTTLVDVLEPWGLVEAERYGPVVAHEALPATEDLGGTLRVEAEATGVVADVDGVRLIYRVGSGPPATLALQPAGGTLYATSLALPDAPSTIHYFLEAVDVDGRRTLHPAQAPAAMLTFEVGPDDEPPSIAHAAPTEAALRTWPLVLTAEVDDNLGVDSVWAEYLVEAPGGAVADSGRFGLTAAEDGRYRAAFPTPLGKLQQDGMVRYRLHARDAARTANRSSTDWYAVPVSAEGALRTYDFETAADLHAAGEWRRGEPGYGLRVARSGRRVWATALDSAYATTPRRSSLALPPINLSGLDAAYLVFWHWYDTEQRLVPDTLLYDGGNVKLSTDGGATYEVAEPLAGYDGLLAQGRLNPMGGEPAFGGYSYGWRRVVIPLPEAADVRIRFDFGTDGFGAADEQGGRSIFTRAGWHLDDVLVTTRLPLDVAPPRVTAAPEAVTLRTPQQRHLPVAVTVSDDQGVTDVFIDYEGFEQGTERLAMNPVDRRLYEGGLEPLGEPTFRDSLAYRLRVVDAAGNVVVYPAHGEAPLLVRYRHVDVHDLLAEARPSGLWTDAHPGWRTHAATAAPAVSSLVLAPLTLPANAESLELALQHRLALGDSLGANVKVTTDGGSTWQVLTPVGGYDAPLDAPPAHPMTGEAVFTGTGGQPRTARFDLTPYTGQPIQLRMDLAAPRALTAAEHWSVEQAGLIAATRSERFETPLTFDLATPYPNPARTSATLHYTLPEDVDGRDVRLEVYDVLGRRVAVPVDARQDAGPHTVTFDLAGWAAGPYFVRLSAGAHQAVTRLVVVR